MLKKLLMPVLELLRGRRDGGGGRFKTNRTGRQQFLKEYIVMQTCKSSTLNNFSGWLKSPKTVATCPSIECAVHSPAYLWCGL
jgi:hypothetical protein